MLFKHVVQFSTVATNDGMMDMELPKDLTILDLVVLEKVEKDSVMDSFGGKLYSSFFDTASLMGTLQVKKLIQINSSIGRSIVNRTEYGEHVLLSAQERANEPLDGLDHAILKAIASGARTFESIRSELNIRSDDLSLHIFRIIKQGYADYEIRNAKLGLNLTENGFKLTGFVPKKPQAAPAASAQPMRPVSVPKGRQLDLSSATGAEDATPANGGKDAKLTGMSKTMAKTSHYIGKYAAAAVVLIAIIAIALYVTGNLSF
ncbi:Uncharacterised protein [uncultured archaeon]|nr:Uncharacterised protein [uncultured archaeon]